MNNVLDSLIDSGARSAALAAGVFLLLWLLRIREASWRHAAWTAVLCAMLSMPFVPQLLPPVPVEVPGPVQPIPVFVEPVRVSWPPSVSTPPAAVPAFDWTRVWLMVYVGGAGVLLVRFLLGWLSALRLSAASRPVPSLGVYESSQVRAPMTIGVFAPKVLLPPGWRDWPADTLAAVLLHERAHVSRRDTAVAVLARVNTCLFWFHPLAWMLERTLAAVAEFACDTAALRVMGSRERYAEVLVTMARHRVLGVGFGGVGLLEKRVDRALAFAPSEKSSMWRKAALAVGCAVVIAAACSRAVPPLRENPMTAEREKQSKDFAEIQRLTPRQVAELERVVAITPGDMEARRKLLTFYAMSGDYVLGREKVVPARRAHVLWLVANHPEHELAGSWDARIFPTENDKDPDPDGYAQAKALWLRAVNRPSVSTAVLDNAATFFQVADKVLAEELLLRAHSMEPGKKWSYRLGHLYYTVLMGSNASMPIGAIRSISLADAHGPHASAVRAKLAASNDAHLLASTGQMLAGLGTRTQIDFDAPALGRSYLERAVQLDPEMARARELLRMLKTQQDHALTFRMPGHEAYEVVAALPDAERLAGLARLAGAAYMRGDSEEYYKHNTAAGKASWAVSRKCVEEALRLAPSRRADESYSSAVHGVNLTAGLLAMRDGDRARAVRHLLAAVDVPPSEAIAYSFDFATFKLAAWLLKDGERESVITFLERLAALHVSQRVYLIESAELIRQGVKPLWYPRPS